MDEKTASKYFKLKNELQFKCLQFFNVDFFNVGYTCAAQIKNFLPDPLAINFS